MAVGHGQLGIRSGLRIFDQLQDESTSRKDALLELEGGAIIDDTWTNPADGTFTYAWAKSFDGEALDVVGVRTLANILARAQSAAECITSAGTYFYALGSGTLRVHLGGDADPSGTSVLVTTTFRFSTGGAERGHLIHPILGAETLSDGGFEQASLFSWIQVVNGAGWTTSRDATELVEGDWSLLLDSTGSAAGDAARRQITNTVAGSHYRLFGYYMTPTTQPATAHVYVRVGTTVSLGADGRTAEGSLTNGIELEPTYGRVRAFCFDYVSHETIPRVWFRLVNSAATACSVRFDLVSLKPIVGWAFYHPRLAADGVPQSSQGSQDVYPGSEDTGYGSVKLLNDGTAVFERIVADWNLLSREARLLFGGCFQDGQEILYNDLYPGISGIVSGDRFLEVTDRYATIQVEDVRTILETLLPIKAYNITDTPNVDARDLGRLRPILFGTRAHIRPTRIAKDGTTTLGIYELNDPAYAVAKAVDTVSVYTYTDDAAATADDVLKRITLTTGTDYTTATATGQVTLVRNPQIFEVVSAFSFSSKTGGAIKQNNMVDFETNGSKYAAAVTPGIYTAAGLATAVAAAMNAVVGGSSMAVTYSNTTHKFSIVWSGAGVLALLLETGQSRDVAIWSLIGFARPGKYTVTTGVNDKIDFDEGVGQLTATLTAGDYDGSQLAAQVQTKMQAAGTGNETCVYQVPTILSPAMTGTTAVSRIIIGRAAGTLNLRCNTGTNLATTAYGLIGFSTAANRTGALSYNANWGLADKGNTLTTQPGDTAVFSDCDVQNFVRMTATGYNDDASGTYTGIIDGSIFRGADVLRYIITKILGEPLSRIDLPSFAQARTDCDQVLSFYLGTGGSAMTVQDVIDRMEASGAADVVMDGRGVFFYRKRSNTLPANPVHLHDRDYLDFRGYFSGNDPYGTVRVNYDQDPSTAKWKSVEVTNPDTLLRDRRPQSRTWDTFLTDQTEAETARAFLAALARAAIRHFEVAVKGRLLKAKVGDLILLTRDQALQPLGGTGSGIDAVPFRILSLQKNYLTYTVRAILHTNILS